ncbi:unnamed protein product [Parajaminaea phylloscopi]
MFRSGSRIAGQLSRQVPTSAQSTSQCVRAGPSGVARSIATTPRPAAPPPPTNKAPKAQLKVHKPSSKVNARTSRLLRSQLGGGTSLADPARFDESTSRAQTEDALAEESTRTAEPSTSSAAVAQLATSSAPQLKEVNAFATASSYDLNALIASGRLPPDWQLLEEGQVIYLPSWPASPHPGPASFTSHRAGSGEVFILKSGAYVTWGINAEQAQRFKSLVLTPRQELSRRGRVPHLQVERGPYEDVGEEEMEYVEEPKEITRVVGDVIIIGQPPVEPDSPTADDPWSPLLARLSFSAGLALSARLSSQETSLSTYLQSVQPIPQMLEDKGRVPISRREVVRKMGRLLKLRQMVNLEEGSKVEELDLFWENARMEQHYDSICTTLDIESRFRALNERLDHAENLMGVLRALLTEGSSHRMELIIIALIAIEVTLALISHDYLYNPFGEPSTASATAKENTADASLVRHASLETRWS